MSAPVAPAAPGAAVAAEPVAPARPVGVWVVAIAAALVAVFAAARLFSSPPDDPTVLVVLALLILLFAYVAYAFWKGEAWARAMLMTLAFAAAALAVVALVVAAGEGKAGESWKLPTALALVSAGIVAWLLARDVAAWYPAVEWRESFKDVKWAIALLFLTMLALFGYNNQAWARKPAGRESLPRLTDLLLTGDPRGLGSDLPLMFLLQLLGVLLVAGLIAAVVIAMRDPAPGEPEEMP